MLALGLSRDRYEKSEMYKMSCGDLTGPALFWEGPHLWFLLLEYSCLSWLRRAGWKEDGLVPNLGGKGKTPNRKALQRSGTTSGYNPNTWETQAELS